MIIILLPRFYLHFEIYNFFIAMSESMIADRVIDWPIYDSIVPIGILLSTYFWYKFNIDLSLTNLIDLQPDIFYSIGTCTYTINVVLYLYIGRYRYLLLDYLLRYKVHRLTYKSWYTVTRSKRKKRYSLSFQPKSHFQPVW